MDGILMELLLNGIIQLCYTIVEESYDTVAIIRKEIFNFTDTYVIDVKDPENALDALMFVLAIDAEKCTRNKRQNN